MCTFSETSKKQVLPGNGPGKIAKQEWNEYQFSRREQPIHVKGQCWKTAYNLWSAMQSAIFALSQGESVWQFAWFFEQRTLGPREASGV
jgi:hypothetical protein